MAAVGGDRDFELAAVGGAGRAHIDLAVPGVAEVAAVGRAQKAHRVGVVVRDLKRLRAIGELKPPHVEVTAALRQVEDGVLAGRPHRLPVVGAELGEPGVLTTLSIVDPHVAREGRVVVLAPVGLEGLLVRVDEALTGRIPCRVNRGRRQYLPRHAAAERHGVELRLRAAPWIADHGAGVEPAREEKNILAVRSEARRKVTGRVVGEPGRVPAVGRHDKDVGPAVAVRGKGDLLTVRRPRRHEVVSGMNGQLGRLASGCRHLPEITTVAEGNGLSVRRDRWVAQPQSGLCRVRRDHSRHQRHTEDPKPDHASELHLSPWFIRDRRTEASDALQECTVSAVKSL